MIVKEKTGPQVPPGTHLAVCYRVVDLGTQPDTGFGSKEKLCIFFELPHERITIKDAAGHDKEVPMGMSRFYSKTLGKRSNLRKDLEAWRGRAFTKEELDGFDLSAILGKACQLQVADNGEGKSQIVAVVGVPKGTSVPPASNPIMEYSISEGKDSAKYKILPEWVRTMCDACIEWQPESEKTSTPMHDAPAGEPVADDSDLVPF